MRNLWHDKSFDRLRNLPAILKCVVLLQLAPVSPMNHESSRLPYISMTVINLHINGFMQKRSKVPGWPMFIAAVQHVPCVLRLQRTYIQEYTQ